MAKKKKSNVDDKKFISDLQSKLTKASNKATSYHRSWREFYKYYRSSIQTVYNDYKYKRVMPVAFSTIMSILPRILQLKPKIRYIMQKYPDVIDDYLNDLNIKALQSTGEGLDIERIKEDAVDMMDYIIKYQWNNKFNGDTVLAQNILTALIYGTSIVRVSWDSKNNCPLLENIEPYYFYPESSATSPFNMNYCFIKNYMSVMSFKEQLKSGYFKRPDDFDTDEEFVEAVLKSNDYIASYKNIKTKKS
jgi:hypothetical protein